MENPIDWELVNPEGTVRLESFKMGERPSTLEGKTVMLRWNGKHNGDVFLNTIGEMLERKVNNVRIIKSWELVPETKESSSSADRSVQLAGRLAAYKPDIVIGSQAD